jgi:hypothetical protein
MASLTVEHPQPGVERGVQYTQKSFTSSDLSSGTAIVGAVSGQVAVLDKLVLVTTASETMSLKSGSDFLLDTIDTEAKGMVTIENIRSNAVNTAITLVVSAGAVAGVAHYHYEISG